MKLKTLPLFLQNQFCKKLIFIGLISLSGKAFSQDSKTPPGLIESFERLSELSKEQYQKSKSSIQAKMNIVTDMNAYQDVKLTPDFVKNLIINSDDRFLRLSDRDECRFLSALETNLLKTSDGNPETIYIEYKNGDKKETAAMPRLDFFDQIYKKKCLNNREFTILFSDTNAPKTIEGIKFAVPKNKQECAVIHKEWLDNSYTPYLCRIQQIIRRSPNRKQASYYQERIPLMQRIYLDNLCGSLSSSENFCSSYLKGDAWSKVINSELPDYKLSYKCRMLFNKKGPVSKEELKTCAAKLASDDAFCETRANPDFPSSFPMQSCNNLSLSLNKSKLVTDYQDCPGNIDNEALTNVHRIVYHFSPRKITSNKENCAGETNYSYARLNLDIKHEAGWPLKVCYKDRIVNEEKCKIYIPGSRETEPLSEDKVIAKILYEQKGASPKTTCRIVDSKTYNPLRTEYKFGCFIVSNTENCTTLSCDKKVIWAEKVQDDIKFIGKPVFDYFPTAFMNERYSFLNLINEVYGTQGREIRNFTDLNFHLEKIPSAIIHGIGCAEDLMPEIFQRISINQCQPLPFIIDGVVKKNNENLLVSRMSIDDIHTPRLIPWTNVFNAISSYKEIHPLGSWTLYGIKK